MKKFYLAIVSVLFFAATGLAQVQLIPASDGGFETGATFAANNWIPVNAPTNPWAVSGAVPAAVFAGTQAVYISTTAGANNNYTTGTAATSHFYRDLIVPAGASNITLSFWLKSSGQLNVDRLLVYTAPTTVTPVLNVPLAPATAIVGATLVYTQSGVAFVTPYAQQTISLPGTLAGTTVRLIFTWENNANTGTQNPAAVDDISLTYIPPIPPTITSFSPASACLGNTITITGTDFTGATAVQFNGVNAASYIVVNNTTITAVLPASGVTTGPITVTTPNGTGTSATNLTINPPAPSALTYTSNSSVYCVGTAITNNTPSNGGGAATAYSVSPALPAGLSIDPVTGIISGTPTAVTASATYTVTASNSCGNTTVALTIEVSTAPVTVTYATNSATYCAGVAIASNSPTTTSGGAPTGYTVSPALPAGLTINAATGVISGTPATTAGIAAATYTVTATNICGSTTVDVVITISPAAPTALTYTLTTASYCVGTAIANNTPSNTGGAPTAYSVSPALPAGLSIDPVTGIISGTPTAVTASATYTVTASNSCGNTTVALTINVSSAPVTVTYATNPATYCAGVAIASNSPTTTSGGAPTGYTVSPALPAGLTLNAATGVISGTPTTTAGVAAATYTVTAANICGSTTVDVVITISPAAPTALTYTLTTTSYCVGTAIANNTPSNTGGAPTAYSVSPALPAGLSIDPVTGIISGTPTAITVSATYTVTASNSCGNTTVALTLDVPSAPVTVTYATNPATYCANIAITANSPTTTSGGAPTGYTVSPALPAGLNLNAATGIISGTPTTTAGIAAATYTVTATNGCGSTTVGVVITISPAAPTALTYTLTAPTYCVGTAIANNTPSNTGGAPTAYSVSPALPAGLSIDPVTGIISGTPTVSIAAANYTVTASNSCGTTTKVLNITVNAAPLITYSTNPATYCAGLLITNNTPTNTGGPVVTYSVSPALPAGLTLNAAGVISGNPTATNGVATATYTVTSTNGCGSTTVGVVITISPAAPTALTYTLTAPTYCVGTAIANNTPSNTGGAPTAYSVSPALPAGLSINSGTGVISGTPTAVTASANYTVTATNSCGNTTKVLTIAVNTTPLITYSTNPATYCAGLLITNNTPTNTGGPAVSYSVSPALPAGLTLNAAGVISGNPTATNGVATATYTVTSTNGCGSTTVGVVITISPAAPTALTYTINSPAYCIGVAIANNNPSNGGGTPTAYSVSPALPAGLTLNTSTGVISGTPTVATAAANYTVTASNSCGNATKVLNITVNSAPSINAGGQPANQTTCAGTPTTFSVTASGTSLTYQWQYSPNNGITPFANVASGTPANINYTNVTTATLTVTPTAAAASGTYFYRCIVSTGGCSSVNSNSATLTVNINSTISLSSAAGTNAQTVCQNIAITNITYAVGGGGTGATVTGLPAGVTGLYSGNTFTINGTPTASGTFNYIVTTTGACTQASASGTITVNPAPTGTLTATENSGIAPNDYIICTGATVTFTATSGYGSYIFKLNGTTVQTGTANVYSNNTLNNGDAVKVDVANGCGTTFGPVTITVTPLPSPTLVADKTTICAGDLVTFTATGGTNYNFKVNGSSVQSGASGTYASSTLTNGNSVTVDVTNGNNCTATSAAIVITVNALPTGILSASPSTTICAGDNLTFTATPGFSNYNFKIDGISVQSSSSNTYSSSALTNGQVVSVIATNGVTSCSGTFNNLLINVNAIPAGTLTVTENSGTPNDNLICAGSPVTFSFSLGFSNYNFKVNGVSKQNSSSNSYINSALVNGDVVTVEVTNGNNCKATFTAAAITIAPSPAGTLTVSPSATICAGYNVVFTATSDPTFTNYNFKINGIPVQNGSGNTYTTTSIANGDIVTVDVTNNNSCVSTFGPVNMTVSPSPTGTLTPVENSGLTANDGTICAGDAIVFTAPTGFANYDFIKGGVTIQSGPGNTYTTSSLATGDQFTVAVTNATGCVGLLNTITVTVNTLPVVAAITGTMSVCLNNTTQLSDVTASGIWMSLNPSIATVNASGLVTGVAAGTATITYTVTNANGCSTTVSATVTVNAPPTVAPITGNTNVCQGTTSQLSDATAGGVWSSSDNSVATVDGTGLVTGVAVGTVNIIYTVTDVNGCSGADTATVTVSTLPSVSPITTTAPSFDVCEGGSIQLKDATPGGTWSSTNPANATISASGVVTGILNGTTTINYTITTTCNISVIASVIVTVHALPSATISYTGGPFCTTAAPVAVNQTGTTGGTYSAAPAGLSIAADGTITPSASAGGTYTVTYTIPASGGCGVYTTTTQVTITTAPSATISYTGGPFCTSSAPVSVTRTGTPGGTYSSTAGLTINSANGTIAPGTSTGGTYTVTYTIAALGGCALYTTTTSVTITTAPSATISYAGSPFCTTSGPITVTRTGTPGGTYSSIAGLTIDGTTGTITPGTSAGGTYTVTYTIAASGGCAIFTTTTSVTITAAPTAIAGTPISTCSNSGAVNITAGSSATNQSSVLWTSSGTAGTIANANSLTTATYTPSAADIAAGSVVLTLTANGNGSCAAAISTKTLTINAFTSITSITATPSAICLGNSSNLSIPSAGISTLLSENFEGASSTFTVVNGIPFTNPARSQWIKETSTYTYNYNCFPIIGCFSSQPFNSGSAHFMLTNSDDGNAPGGVNNTNTSLVSPTISTVGYTALNFSYRTYYRQAPDVAVVEVSTNGGASWTTVQNIVPGGTIGTGTAFVTQNVNLNAYINNASFQVRFRYTTNNQWWWAVDDINLTGTAAASGNYSWTAVPAATAGLPAGAGTPSPANANIVVTPTATGNTVYTATLTNAAGCTSSNTTTVTVNPTPVVTITANYCGPVPGKVRLTASSVPAATSYLWSTGATTSFIDVDIAGNYDVSVFAGGACPGTANIDIANELVVNGDFEAGNTGFISPPLGANQYQYRANVAGNNELVPEGLYGVGTDGQNYHNNFWGHDHTSGSGNFMIVNGFPNGNPQPIVWQETVNVLPNTTYYFSGWGISLNNAGPFAQLQFNVNGTQVGSVATLAAGVNNNSNNGWTRFYGTLLTGAAQTTAVISITDLQNAAGGNDFGLDDISFSTLSTFVTLESAPGTDAQTICVNTPLTNIVYAIGNGNPTGPTVSVLPAGVTSVFFQDRLTISGTPTVAGNYTYSITTTGCSPYTVTGTITVQGQKITLSSGSASPTVCVNTPVNIGYTLGGTATGATATGLPAGVNISVAGTAVTISGTPTVAGSYPYTITTSGNCTPVTVSGTITVQAQTITLNSGNNTQTVCINTPISNIQYTIGGTGTNASVSGLPPGVTGIYNSGFFIISGSPTSAAGSPYTYTVTTSGASCAAVTATGTITVTPAAGLTLTSGAGTNTQTVCKGSAITNITYSVNNGTGASVSGLPAGVTGSYAAGVFTITGTPSVGGTFTYTITTSGGCGFATATGTITVQEQTLVLTSGSASPTVCVNALLPGIVYTFGGTATSATVTGLPAGVNFSIAGSTLTISGTPTVSGSFPYTVTTSGTCNQLTAGGTITVQPSAIGGSLTSVSICSGSNASLTLSGQVGSIIRWEKSTDGGTTWTPIANTTITQTFINVVVPTLSRVVVGNGCGNVFSTVALVGIHNLWTGAINTDWNTAGNWSDNLVPSISCPDVYIPNTPNKPILSGLPVATINNLHIFAGASVTINGTGLLQIAGTISNLGIFDVSNGAIEFNGTSPQTIAANTFMNNAINDLIITNSAGTGITLGGTQNVYRSLTYGKNGAILNTGGFLTLKSTITQTAWLGDMTNHTINGDVTVERYIATGTTGAPNHGKSWQLLAVPTQGQTIKASWQEGATLTNVSSPAPGSLGNPVAGYGTMITSDVAGAATQPSPGFDAFTSPGPTVKVYDYLTTLYVGPPNTNATQVYNQKGYFVFVRGDRSVFTSGGAATPTILRTKGTLFTPATPPPTTTVFAGKFESVGNPYASAIDMRNITLTPGTQQFFIVWDPRLGGAYNYGAFQTLSFDGTNYTATPGGGSYGSGPVNFIQSGQAFFVQAFGSNGTVSFTESCKANGSSLFTTPNPVNQVQHTLRTSLNIVNADGSTGSIVDGVLSQFDDTYSNNVDGMDARKLINTGENLSIKTAGKLLAIERKHTITQQDTIFLNITGERAQPYRFHFDAENLDPSVQGFLVDSYTNTRTPLNMTGGTDVNFTVANVTGSNAANRFMIVFEPLKALPVTFTSIKAYKQDKNINVEWRVDNELNMKQYEVEKSTDGTQFSSIAIKAATANNGGSAVYVITDANPVEGFNYYRIKSVDVNGKLSYTNVVKVLVGSMKQDITIYPNPITDGMIHLQLINMPGGKYNIRLLNKLGQLIVQKQITHAGGNATELIKWDFNLAHGMYQLEVTKPDGTVKDLNVMY